MQTEIIALDKPNFIPPGSHLLIQVVHHVPTAGNSLIGLDGQPLTIEIPPYDRYFVAAVGPLVKKMEGYEDIDLFDEVIIPHYAQPIRIGSNNKGEDIFETRWYLVPQQIITDKLTVPQTEFMIVNHTDILSYRKTDQKLAKFKNQ